MSTVVRDSQINESVALCVNRKLYQQRVDFIKKLNSWTHFLTLTYSQPSGFFHIGQIEVLRRSRLFLSILNQKIFGRHGCRRNGFKVGSCAVLGWGSYGDHPHTHWLLAKPPYMHGEEFSSLIRLSASTTDGLGREWDLQTIYSSQIVEYIVNHGFEGWISQVTFAAKCPVR
jgi:hypothetical protein